MPWQKCYKMDERLRFVARLLDGENMAALCREFDVTRKTGYKIFQRYLARQFYGLRLRVLRSRDRSARKRRKFLRRESLTRVSAINPNDSSRYRSDEGTV